MIKQAPCSACEQHQLLQAAHACPNCGHFTFLSTIMDKEYEGSLSDYELQEEELRDERMSDAFERASEDLQEYDYIY